MTIPPARARLLGAVLTATAVALLATAAYAGSGPRGGSATVPQGAVATFDPPSQPPPGPTAAPTPDPTPAPTPDPTPDPTEPPEGTCPAEPTPLPTTLALASYRALAGPVTCEDLHSNITVSWDGKKLTIVIKPVTDFAEGKCELDKKSVKATEPNNAKVNADGSVEVPYDKDKNQKITIKVEYDFKCVLGDLTIILKKIVTVEFTPPDGPVVIKNKQRP